MKIIRSVKQATELLSGLTISEPSYSDFINCSISACNGADVKLPSDNILKKVWASGFNERAIIQNRVIVKTSLKEEVGFKLVNSCVLNMRDYKTAIKRYSIENHIPLLASKPKKNIVGTSSILDVTSNIYPKQPLASREAFKRVLDCGGYMPDINLHNGFNYVVGLARDELKRELVKKERKQLLVAYVKAVNKYQLVLLNADTKPFTITGGNIWFNTGGNRERFIDLVELTLNRKLTKKEFHFINPQFYSITADKRAGVVNDCSVSNLYAKSNDAIKEIMLVATNGRKNGKRDITMRFAYGKLKKELKDKLNGFTNKAGKYIESSITHDEYNIKLTKLKEARKIALADIKQHSDNLRNNDKKAGIRLMNNAAGLEFKNTGSKRYAEDDYPHTIEYTNGTTRGITFEAATLLEKNAILENDNGAKLPKHLQQHFIPADANRSEVLSYINRLFYNDTPDKARNFNEIFEQLRTI